MTTCTATRHGTMSAYQRAGCRCPAACEDHRLYYKRRRTGRDYRRLHDTTGTRRRIQALYAIGHTAADIAAHTSGLHPRVIQRLAATTLLAATTRTLHEIDTAYTALRHTPGTSIRNINRAHRSSWPTPAEWDAWGDIDDPEPAATDPARTVDELAVQMVIARTRPLDILTPAEQAHLYRTLTDQGLSKGQIRHRLGLSATQTTRIAKHARKEPQ